MTWGDRGLQRVTGGDRGVTKGLIQEIKKGYRGLQEVTGGYKG